MSLLSISILFFPLIALIMATVLPWRGSAQPGQILRVFGNLTIIRLFGAIAGYLLGKEEQGMSLVLRSLSADSDFPKRCPLARTFNALRARGNFCLRQATGAFVAAERRPAPFFANPANAQQR